MEKASNIAALRSIAPHWSLAGDKQLLNVLEDIHQKIMTRCQETNTKLEEMVSALDGANIDLQNVNNKFMALSNSQFVESRVYDDDLEVVAENTQAKQETTKPSVEQQVDSELIKLKQSLKILESMHESVRILDSDSDSDTDEVDGRMVYKPIDLYAERPLPHIIGSQAWKNKWHAGIIPEDSDSDSSASKPGDVRAEQYSDSESAPEPERSDARMDRLHPPPRTVSSSSSAAESEPSAPAAPAAPASQAHVAAELARKLAGNLPQLPPRSPEPEFTKPQSATNVYKPSKPATSTIFFDEPPPLDQAYQSDRDDLNEEEDDDIFAELRKSKPSFEKNNDQERLNDDLFGGLNTSQDVVDDIFGTEIKDSHLSSEIKKREVEDAKAISKKPIGGISMFGSSTGTESIGAAILKRNQRKSYSSEEESEKEIKENKHKTLKENKKENVKAATNSTSSRLNLNKQEDSRDNVIRHQNDSILERNSVKTAEKDILQNLFDKNVPPKSKNNNKSITQDINSRDKKIDLFSDDLFDDIDNIFTGNVVKVPKEAKKTAKSIFDDDDDDDLFANVAVTNPTVANSKKPDHIPNSLFDSENDDDLFSDTPNETPTYLTSPANIRTENINSKNNVVSVNNKETKVIFDDDNDCDVFSKPKTDSVMVKKTSDLDVRKQFEEQILSDDDRNNLCIDNNIRVNKTVSEQEKISNIISVKPEQINDKNNSEQDEKSSQNNPNVSSTHYESSDKASELSPALFGEEYDDFLSENENKINKEESNYRDLKKQSDILPCVTNENLEASFDTSASINRKETGKFEPNNFKSGGTQSAKKELRNSSKLEIEDEVVPSSVLSKSNLESDDEQESHSDTRLLNSNVLFVNEIESSPLISDQSKVPLQETDIFGDIFTDVPPAFEKLKEPKRSKNVNALFDDDSDDESLFFKKDNAISDEKPNLNSNSKVDNLFSIFSDEPPSIEVVLNEDNAKHIKSEIESKEYDTINADSLSFSQPSTQITNDEIMQSNLPEKEQEIEDAINKTKKIETKTTIGKLKTIDFNINVNTLLPGAYPKKLKHANEHDDHTIPVVNSDAHNDLQNVETKLIKSSSFDGEADSELLDNKFSKERAKIQVKRRPSTRRARQEAVKKSGIDFGNNNSPALRGNSSSVDTKVAIDRPLDDTTNDSIVASNKEKDVKSKIVYILHDEDIFDNVKNVEHKEQNSKISSTYKIENIEHSPKSNNNLEFEKDDIFRNISGSTVTVSENSKITDEKSSKNQENNILTQQRKVDKENRNSSIKAEVSNEKSKKTKASIFDDMSDEEVELFRGKEPLSLTKSKVFGSDSDEELFGSTNTKPAEKIGVEPQTARFKVEAKKSLFHDDDSDDDLFGTKSNNSDKNQLFAKPKNMKPTQTQTVIEDPLSLFSDED